MSADKNLAPEQFSLDLQFNPPKGDQQASPSSPRATTKDFTALRSAYFKSTESPYQATYDGSHWAKLRGDA